MFENKNNTLTKKLKEEYGLSSWIHHAGLWAQMQSAPKANEQNSFFISRHILAQTSSPSHMNLEKLLNSLNQAVDVSQATRLRSFITAHPNGKTFTAVVVIEESHIIIHASLENLTIDAYTCGQKADPEKIIHQLSKKWGIEIISFQLLQRGLYHNENPEDKFCSSPETLRLADLSSMTTVATPEFSQAFHVVAEFYACDYRINLRGKMLEIFEDILEELEIKSLFSFSYEFQPQGLSVVMIGEGFHLTMHSWPELNYAPIDLFCSNLISYEIIAETINGLEKRLGAHGSECRFVRR